MEKRKASDMDEYLIPFTHRHLDPVERLGEVLFGLIMALGFTGAVRLGVEEADNRTLLVGILGCNVAWAVVDGVMYVLTALFERGRRTRILRAVLKAPTDEDAMRLIAWELGDQLEPMTTEDQRRQIYHWAIECIRRGSHEKARVHWEDLTGAVAVALLIIVATVPIVIPFIVIDSPDTAVHVSNLIAVGLLFLLGCWWGRQVGVNAVRVGIGLTLLGVALVLITIVLGG